MAMVIFLINECIILPYCVTCKAIILTYTINAVDDGIVATVAHCQPMTTKENYVNVFISEKDKRKYNVAQKELNICIK